MSFSSLKKFDDIDRLKREIEKSTQKNSSVDDRFWKPETDKTGNGYAVIRFLPAPEVDGDAALPWVRIFDHGFKGPGGWYIENSRTTLGESDPVSEYNSELWNSGVEANKEIARKQKRRLKYISNILVVEDPKHPENEGKVFLYKYGKKIFDKITESMHPQFADEKSVNVFSFYTGANFKLKVRNFEGFPNYDKSSFDEPTKLLNMDDKELEAIYNKQYSLVEFLDPKHFKSYDDLKKRLDLVLGNVRKPVQTHTDDEEVEYEEEIVKAVRNKKKAASIEDIEETGNSDDALERFQKLAYGE